MEYKDKFKDPRWQKLRLKILERDNWCCQACHDSKASLQIHHRYYENGKEPWDYEQEALITLCEDCHEKEKCERPLYEKSLLRGLKEKFLSNEVSEIAIGIHLMPMLHSPDVIASVYSWAMNNDNIQQYLIDEYFKFIKKNKFVEELKSAGKVNPNTMTGKALLNL